MPKLTQVEVNEFLQERAHLVRIATINTSGAPSVVRVWFVCEGGKILISPNKDCFAEFILSGAQRSRRTRNDSRF